MNNPENLQLLCERRVRELDSWREGSEKAVLYLGELLEIQPPHELLEDPRLGLLALDSLCGHDEVTDVTEGDDLWLTTHLMAYVAEYIIKKFDAQWTVDTDPTSSTYAQYMVAARTPSGEAVAIDVGKKVSSFLMQPPGRSLLCLIAETEQVLTN